MFVQLTFLKDNTYLKGGQSGGGAVPPSTSNQVYLLPTLSKFKSTDLYNHSA